MNFDIQIGADALHGVSQALLLPTVFGLLFLIGFAVYQLGSLVTEYLSERRHLSARLPHMMHEIDEAPVAALVDVTEHSGLLRRQKRALFEVIAARGLPLEARVSLARGLLANEEGHYQRIVGRTDAVSRIAPMLGLMGTLIPLAPGLMGLAQGDVKTLSDSLLVAFDTTIVGLATSAVCYLISRIRHRWYEGYVVMLEALMTALVEKLGQPAPERAAEGGVQA